MRSFSTATMIQSKLLEYKPFILNRIHNYIKSTDGTLKKLRKHCKIKQLPPRYKNKKKNHTQNALSSRPHKLPATETLPLTQRSRQQVQGFQFFFHTPPRNTNWAIQPSGINRHRGHQRFISYCDVKVVWLGVWPHAFP